MPKQEEPIILMVRIAPDQIPEFRETVRELDPRFSVPERITVVQDEAPDSAIMMGWQAVQKAVQINKYLDQSGLSPRLPEEIGDLSPTAIRELLQLAIEHFNWDAKNRLEGAWWLQEETTWPEITQGLPHLFRS